MLDRRLAFEIFELDAQALRGSHGFFRIAADVTLTLEHVEDARAQLGSGGNHAVLAGLLAVADAGEHITQGIGQWHS